MKVKDLKKMLEGKDNEKNVVFVSTSGIAWDINTDVEPKDKDKEKQVIIYIK